ncbi:MULTISPECIES: VTT domain-containing protein [Mucilaginibacter]|uniref:VTT domain-containing protein n=1 Tax=Mucilaginibacter TaxID=423349 RepID=UPI002696DCE4|nr:MULTISPECIES: VTT domain-containing protein [Mucilaginibacter]
MSIYLAGLISHYHSSTYLILFGMIFIETGIVVVPFIPGDSLLFATGALVAGGNTGLNIYLLALLLILAAFAGDVLNYKLGGYFGPRVFKKDNKILRLEYYQRAKSFFDQYGGKSIAFGRFIPMIRTFAPFVAGVSRMPIVRFLSFNIAGGSVWVILFLAIGYFFGNIPLIKDHFSLFVIAIVVISLIPVGLAAFRNEKHS